MEHEKMVRDRLHRLGCEVELGTELVGFEQDEQGVTARVRRHQGEGIEAIEESIRASYLIGADGAKG